MASKLPLSKDQTPRVPPTESPWSNTLPKRASYPGAPRQSDAATVQQSGATVERIPGDGYPGEPWRSPAVKGGGGLRR